MWDYQCLCVDINNCRNRYHYPTGHSSHGDIPSTRLRPPDVALFYVISSNQLNYLCPQYLYAEENHVGE